MKKVIVGNHHAVVWKEIWWILTQIKFFLRRDSFLLNVKKIMNLHFFNRIKQFMIRLFHNNIFLGDKASNKMKTINQKCYACGCHPEACVELMMNCSRTNNLSQFLIRILKKFGGLQKGCEIDMFMLKKLPN